MTARLSTVASLVTLVAALAPLAPASAAAAAEPVEWVALGDSYTAGVFVGAPEPALGQHRDGCDRTSGSYPDLVANELAADQPKRPVALTDVSCGAATITDVHTSSQVPVSPVEPPRAAWPAVPAQIARAGLDAQTDVVTIGIGGNSMPLGSMVATCLFLGTGQDDDATPCRDAYDGGSPFVSEPIRDTFARVFREYAEMLEAVHDRAPNAKVITVGYPDIFPADPSHCDRSDTSHLAAVVNDTPVSMTRGDIAWLHDVTSELNNIVEDATDLVDHDYTYVDTAAHSHGHDVCRPAGTKWVEGVCGHAESYWPTALTMSVAQVTFTLPCSDGRQATIVHPNRNGYANTATHVERAVRQAVNTLP